MSGDIIRKKQGSHRGIAWEVVCTEHDLNIGWSFKFGHCLYLYLTRGMNPQKFIQPEISKYTLSKEYKGWNYSNIPLAQLGWHGGVTFYEEKLNLLTNKIEIKIGCDYQHSWDDNYMVYESMDILEQDAIRLIDELFEKFPDTKTDR